MSQWICCNSCFKSPGPDIHLAVTNCGHIICNICFRKGKEGECLICKAKCQLSLLSDKSSSEIKALFSDISTTAVKYFSEISKVLQFQARHQKRLLAHYQQKSEKMKEALIKMQQEMKEMSKKIAEQTAYISKLEVALQQQSSRVGFQSSRDLNTSNRFKPGYSSSPTSSAASVTKIPYSSPVCLSRHSSSASLTENMDMDSRAFPITTSMSGSVSRLCLISPPQDGRIGTIPHRAASQSTMGSHSIQGANVSRVLSSSLKEPMLASSNNTLYCKETPWEMPVFKMPPTYKYPSMPSLGPPP
ncbi:probable E3 SUMO-protein ligase RNF212 [Clarias gariepinus]|uniref:probable E3 SUMO-protein ligase RNF212 n=1 Tax=Clarias gariepinus TaxID=13013 RepID=UPI00234DCE03|nr:probable E3 SUMO-protein ligase RNF212 [Clarias gariepinus]XP_053361473.1 probable E3 SUMO-protein ligase RNF212 [Clarias gariepinus]